MTQNFTTHIEHLRHRLQRRRFIVSTCWAVAGLIAAVLALTTLDRALGINDLLGRMICTAALAYIGVLVGRRWLNQVWLRPVTLQQTAHRIERRHPQLRDTVTSALDFSQQAEDDPLAGSGSLRRAVVLCAGSKLEDVDWQQLVPWRPLRQALIAAGAALIVVLAIGLWSPQALGIGVTRLLNPISTAEWPRVNDLRFVDPPQVLAAGDDLGLQLCDTRGSLPSPIAMHYRTWQNGIWQVETDLLNPSGSTLDIRRPNVQQSLEYRATGGDHHNMTWQRLRVVVPPRLENLQIAIHPPEYTGLPNSEWNSGVHVLAGSGLEVRGEVDQPVTHVVLLSDQGLSFPARIDSEDRGFHIAPDKLRVEQSDRFFFELTTAQGLTVQSARQLTIEVVPDLPPEIRFVEPADDLTVTPAAVVPLVIDARDELAIRDVSLVFQRTDRSEEGEQFLPVYQGPDVATVPPEAQQSQFEYLWQLAELSLQPGTTVEVHAQANDYQPETGQTNYPLRLRVISVEDMLRETAERETRLLQILERLLLQQQMLRERTAVWETGPNWPTLRWENEARAALSRQQQISDTLSDDRNGVIPALEGVLADFQRNDIVRPLATKRLRTVRDLLEDLVDGSLSIAQQEIGDILRLTKQIASNISAGNADLVASIARHQEDAIETLARAIDALSQEQARARFDSELAVLQAEQSQLAEESHRQLAVDDSAARARTISKSALQQGQLERRLGKLLARMSLAANEQSTNGNCLAETVALARDIAVQTTMRSAADSLVQQRLGMASTQQEKASGDLQLMRQQLAQTNAKEQQRDNASADTQGKPQPANAESAAEAERLGAAGTTPKEAGPSTSATGIEFPTNRRSLSMLVTDLWGHLPERQREQILQPLGEEFLPEYAEEIEAYFRALAEPQESP